MQHLERSESTLGLLASIWHHLSRRRRIQFAMLSIVMIVSAAAELLSLGAVLPFLALLSEPDVLLQRADVQDLVSLIGLTRPNQLLLFATLNFASTAVFAGCIRLLNVWLNGRLVAAVGSDLGHDAYKKTLYQPYEVHIRRNSSEVITSISTQVDLAVSALNASLQLITASIIATALIVGLLLIDAQVALATTIVFGCAYMVLAFVARRELRSNGHKIEETSAKQLKALQEGLGAIRDVLLDGTQDAYLKSYGYADRPRRQFQAKNVFIASFPRYAFEALCMVSIAILGFLLVLQRGSGASVIPLLGSLALGAQRLLPALQQIYSGWAVLKSCSAAMATVLEMLSLPLPLRAAKANTIQLQNKLIFRNVDFRYHPNQNYILHDLNLEIKSGESIGFIGSTGSGKSTTLDLIMGLLKPTSGSILVDGVDLYDSACPQLLYDWRASIAHVPQSIYLVDSSIAENIAFGVPKHLVNLERVRKAAEQAQISSFIESCEYGYDTVVGEQGIRLSGGQRQRIGIARALYKQASILIFDEATSALDNRTERLLIESLSKLKEQMTIIMIAHRLTTVENCDRLIHLEEGKITDEGPPSKVLQT